MYAGLFTRGGAADGALAANSQPFLSATQSQALTMLMDAVGRRAPVALLTGAPGVGKTALLHEMVATLFGTPVQIIKVAHPLPRPLELQRLIATPLGLRDAELLTPTEVARALARPSDGAGATDPDRRILLLVDDAQSMPQETLRYLGLMAELLGGRMALLQIVLCGQSSLLETLRHPDLASLLRRVEVHAIIDSLTSAETRDYLDHRLALAGLSIRTSLAQPALGDVLAFADGSPRAIDGFVGRVLRQRLGSKGGRITRKVLLTQELIPEAAVGTPSMLPGGAALPWAAALFAVAVGVGLAFQYRDALQELAAPQLAALQGRWREVTAGPPPAAQVVAVDAVPPSPVPPAPASAPPPATAAEAAGGISDTTADAVIADLLTAAQVQIAAGHIGAPPHDNVLETFQALNEVLPHASAAGRALVVGMANVFAERARAADAAGQHDEADRFRMFAGNSTPPSAAPPPAAPAPLPPVASPPAVPPQAALPPPAESPSSTAASGEPQGQPTAPALVVPPAVVSPPAEADRLPVAAPPRVRLVITRNDTHAETDASATANKLRNAGLQVDDPVTDRLHVSSRISYFYAQDSENAMRVENNLETLLGSKRPVVLTRREPMPPPGTVEVVLP